MPQNPYHDGVQLIQDSSRHSAFGPRMLNIAAPQLLGMYGGSGAMTSAQNASPGLQQLLRQGAFAPETGSNFKTIAESKQFKEKLTEAYGRVTNARGGPFATSFYRSFAPIIEEILYGRMQLDDAVKQLDEKATEYTAELPPARPEPIQSIHSGSVSPVFGALDARTQRPR